MRVCPNCNQAVDDKKSLCASCGFDFLGWYSELRRQMSETIYAMNRCPDCQKDDFEVVSINGALMKQCRVCKICYQALEQSPHIPFPPSAKGPDGKFGRCPKCFSDNIAVITGTAYHEPVLRAGKYRYPVRREGEYICLARNCHYQWDDIGHF